MKPFIPLLLALIFPLIANATQERSQLSNQPRQTIAVVLAGGGAKGAAHVGVLKRLEELRIPVDYITGTSIGAYVGGLYATGLSASDIENILTTQDWNQGYTDRISRSDRSIRSKSKGDRYQVHTDLGIHSTSIQASNGMLQGQSMLKLLRQTTGNITKLESFDELAIPYRAVATNINTMEADVLDSGYLPDAMMASMSIPALLPPFEINGQKYVDGGVTNNMPIVAAKRMGADIIIAIDVSSNYSDQADIHGMADMLNQLSIHMVKRSTDNQINTLTVRDIYLKPDVGHIETTDFSAMPFALEKGYQSTARVLDKLIALSVSDEEYQKYQNDKRRRREQLFEVDTFVIHEIEIQNRSHYALDTLYHQLGLSQGKVYSAQDVEAAVDSLYSLDNFELVTYQIERNEGKTKLHVNVKEKSWGPNYLDFRIHIEEDFNANSIYSIGAVTHFTNINNEGGEAWLGVDLGTSKRVDAEYVQPLTLANKLTWGAGLHYFSDTGNILFDPDEKLVNQGNNDFIPYDKKSFITEFELTFNAALWHEISVGYNFEYGDTSITPMPSLGEVDYQRHGVYGRYQFDTLDDLTFPRSGFLAKVDIHQYNDDYQVSGTQSEQPTTRELDSTIRIVESFGRHTLDTKLEYALIDTDDDAIAVTPVRLGGFLNLSGLPRDSLAGKEKVYSSLSYRYQWLENDFGLFQSPVYLGASVEKGGVWQDTSLKVQDVDLYKSGAAFVGVDSPIGTIVLSYSRVNSGNDAVYFIIGTPFP
ncbi:patatin-like phospholipase family protein [Vibrio chagasii]|uniref:patatin-like phospholipase family protein n=1 Tax=Vibrio chagasii TaxID=170679 RepID=UPI003DAA3835